MKKTISGFIVFILGSIVLLHLALYIGGFRFFAVKSESMEPDIPKFSLIYTRSYKTKEDFFNNVGYNMDITYKTESGTIVTHRIIYIDEMNDILQTQSIIEGSSPDAKITRNQVIGKVVKVIPVVGFFVLIIQSWYFWVMLIAIIAIVYIVKRIINEIKEENPEYFKQKTQTKNKNKKKKNKK